MKLHGKERDANYTGGKNRLNEVEGNKDAEERKKKSTRVEKRGIMKQRGKKTRKVG